MGMGMWMGSASMSVNGMGSILRVMGFSHVKLCLHDSRKRVAGFVVSYGYASPVQLLYVVQGLPRRYLGSLHTKDG